MNRVLVLLACLVLAAGVCRAETGERHASDSVTATADVKADPETANASTTTNAAEANAAEGAGRKSFVSRVVGAVSDFLMGCDTSYVARVPYHLTAELTLNRWHDYYMMSSSETGNRMTIKSDPTMVVGGYIYYSCLGYGVSYNVDDFGKAKGEMNGTGIRTSLVVHTAKVFAEYYRFNSGKSAEIISVSKMDLRGHDNRFKGLDSRCSGVNMIYIFNNKRFSWPAAFSGSAVQKRSSGSWSLGFQYNRQRVRFNKEELPAHIKEDIDPTLMFSEVDYTDYNASVGYSYNWVMGRNVMLATSVLPNVGYRRSNITEATNRHDIISNVATDLNFRASLMWNNLKTYNALMLELHTYSYRKDHFGLTNAYGTLKLVCGLQFLRKKP